MTPSALGGPELPQERRLVTDIPGPRLAGAARPQEDLRRRRSRHRAAGLRHRGRWRRPRRRRRQLADRPRLRHRRHHGRQRRPRVVAPGPGAGRGVHPHLLHGHAVRRLRRRLRGRWPSSPRATTRRSRRCSTPAPRRSRTPSRSPASATGRDAVGGLRPRLPRPHQPDDGDDRQEHALQARLRAVRRRGLPGADVLPVPRRADRRADAAARAIDVLEKQVGADNLAALVIEPIQGEGGFVVPAAGLPARAVRVVRAPTASCSSPTRSRPASAAPATGSPATTRASSPT